MTDVDYKIKTVVLRPLLDSDEASQIVENRKTSLFRKMLQKPKKSEVHVHSIKLFYEAFLILSGKYTANYYRKNMHTITVDPTVKEIIIGDEIFPVKRGKGIMGKLNTKIQTTTKRKNKIDLELEEHVFLEEEQEIAFDHHGKEINLSYKDTVKLLDKHPKKTINEDKESIRRPEITIDAAKSKLISKLKKPADAGTKSSEEIFDFRDILEIYVPIYEARLIGPKKRIKIVRIDAVRKKIL